MLPTAMLLLSLAAHARTELPTTAVSVPYERSSSNHIVIQVALGSGPAHAWIVDSGASATVLAPEAWAEAGRDPEKGLRVAARGAGGKVEGTRIVTGVEVSINGSPIRVGAAAVMPLDLAIPGQPPISGVLGRDVLSQFVVEIDDHTHILTLHPSGTELAREEMEVLPMHRVRANLTAAIARLGDVEADAVIDLGASMTVLNAAAAALPGLQPHPCEGSAMGADGVAFDLACVEIQRFALGSLELGPVTLASVALPIFKPLRLERRPALILGNDVYSGRRVILDDGRKELWLSREPMAGPHAPPAAPPAPQVGQ